jgi:hypothetical protein
MSPSFLQLDWSSLDWAPIFPFVRSRTEIRAVPTGPGV